MDVKTLIDSMAKVRLEKLEKLSPSSRGFCKNKGCNNANRHCSAYCQECSNKINQTIGIAAAIDQAGRRNQPPRTIA